MSIMLASTDTLQVVLASAPATNQLPVNVSYVDQGGSGGNQPTTTTGTTAVTVVPSPASGIERLVSHVSIPNIDTAAVTVTVNVVRSGTAHEECKITLPVGYRLGYDERWHVIDANGNFLCNVTVTGGTLTANQGAAAALSGAWPVEVTDGTNVLGTASHPIRNDPTGTTTQPVSGTVTTTPPANASTNITQFGGISLSTGTGASGTGIPRVTVSNDSTHPVTQSGAWAVSLSAGTAAIGTVGVTSLPVLPAGSNTIGALYQAPMNWTINAVLSTTAVTTYGATASQTKLRGIKIDLFGVTTSGLTGIIIKDGAGNTLYTYNLPTIATAVSVYNFFFSDFENITMNNASGGATASLSMALAGGTIGIQIAYSN